MSKTIVLKGIGAYKKAMKDAKKNMETAVVNAVNRTAFTARKNAVSNVQKQFTLRNSFTVKQIYTTPAKKNANIANIKAKTGALEKAGYMARQETGGSKTSASGSNLVIPNTRARGGSNKNKVRPQFTYTSVRKNTVRWSSHRSRIVATAAYAAAHKDKFMRINNSFFKVSQFHRQKKLKKIKFQLKQILNLKHKSTYTPAKPWLEPASEHAAKLTQQFYNEEMDKL